MSFNGVGGSDGFLVRCAGVCLVGGTVGAVVDVCGAAVSGGDGFLVSCGFGGGDGFFVFGGGGEDAGGR